MTRKQVVSTLNAMGYALMVTDDGEDVLVKALGDPIPVIISEIVVRDDVLLKEIWIETSEEYIAENDCEYRTVYNDFGKLFYRSVKETGFWYRDSVDTSTLYEYMITGKGSVPIHSI